MNCSVRQGFVILVLLLSAPAHAFLSGRCKSHRDHLGRWDPTGITPVTSSTLEWSSSCGPCRLITGDPEQARSNYIASQIEPLQVEIARSGGEHIDTLAYLYGCDETGSQELAEILNRSYLKLFGTSSHLDADSAIDQAGQAIDLEMKSNPSLKQHCHFI